MAYGFVYNLSMSSTDETVATYDRSAKEIAAYFKSIGPRTKDIELGLRLSKVDGAQARVVEIGCGDGRDAAEIIKRVAWYEGFDPSKGLLEIARAGVTGGNFVLANALDYAYPSNIDVVFAFASLLHLSQGDFTTACADVARALRPGGIFLISLKERPSYEKLVKHDKYGVRTFYFYNADLVAQMCGANFESAFIHHEVMDGTDWFTMALRRR